MSTRSRAIMADRKITKYILSLEFSTHYTLVNFFGFRETFLPSFKVKTGC
jgi:hypothetical protein